MVRWRVVAGNRLRGSRFALEGTKVLLRGSGPKHHSKRNGHVPYNTAHDTLCPHTEICHLSCYNERPNMDPSKTKRRFIHPSS